MLPSASMMKPLPAPRRGVDSRSLGGPKSSGPSSDGAEGRAPRGRRLPLPLVVVSMLTTAGFRRSTTSAKLTREAMAGAAAVRARRPAAADLGEGPADTAGRTKPPATIAPTRNATTAVSVTVTRVNRRDMSDQL